MALAIVEVEAVGVDPLSVETLRVDKEEEEEMEEEDQQEEEDSEEEALTMKNQLNRPQIFKKPLLLLHHQQLFKHNKEYPPLFLSLKL